MIKKIKYDDNYGNKSDTFKIYANQFELAEKVNEIIDKMNNKTCDISVSKSLEYPIGGSGGTGDPIFTSDDKSKKDFTFISKHNKCQVKCTIHYKTGRITIESFISGTNLNLKERRVSTIEGIAKCMLEAVEKYKNEQPSGHY